MNPSELAALIAKRAELQTRLGGFEIWLLVFGICVAIGVAGESIFGARAWWNNRKLHAIQQEIDTENESLARKESDAFTLAIADANARASAAAERAAKAELDLERFKAPRMIDDEAFRRIAATLSIFSGQKFTIVTYLDEREPRDFTNRVFGLLQSAKWQYIQNGGFLGLTDLIEGVELVTGPNSTERTKAAARAAQSALASEGILATVVVLKTDPSGTDVVLVRVGKKPPA